MNRYILALLFLFITCPSVFPAEVRQDETQDARFLEASDLYADGDYCRAREVYGDLIEQGFTGSALFYNMGNASFRCGELGQAILYFEKAKRISPRDRDINHNLAFARQRITQDGEEPDLMTVLLVGVTSFLSKKELFILEGTGSILLAAFAVCYLGSRHGRRKRILGVLTYVTGVVVFLSLVLLFVRIIDERNTEAIVVAAHVEAVSGPGEDNMKVLSLPEGVKVWVDEDRGGWSLIHVSTGRGGWVKNDCIGII